MSRHKNIAGIIKDSYYDEYDDDYGDEDYNYVQTATNKKKAGIQDEEYGDEEEPIKVKKKKSKTSTHSPMMTTFIENQVDEKVAKEIFDHFQKSFTLDQVRSTLLANYNEKAKTISDLQYKQGRDCQPLMMHYRLTQEEGQRQSEGCELGEDVEIRRREEVAFLGVRGDEED